VKPKVAWPVGFARLGINAGDEIKSPSGEKTGSLPIWPPPVTLPGAEGSPPRHGPPGARARSHGVKSASPTTSSPVPDRLFGTFNGPVEEPHQLHSALTVPACARGSTVSPVSVKLVEPTVPMLFWWIATSELATPTA